MALECFLFTVGITPYWMAGVFLVCPKITSEFFPLQNIYSRMDYWMEYLLPMGVLDGVPALSLDEVPFLNYGSMQSIDLFKLPSHYHYCNQTI